MHPAGSVPLLTLSLPEGVRDANLQLHFTARDVEGKFWRCIPRGKGPN